MSKTFERDTVTKWLDSNRFAKIETPAYNVVTQAYIKAVTTEAPNRPVVGHR